MNFDTPERPREPDAKAASSMEKGSPAGARGTRGVEPSAAHAGLNSLDGLQVAEGLATGGLGVAARDEVSGDLLEAFRLGDRQAFDQIVGTYEGPLVRFFYRLCWDRDRAEDFAQDVFLKLLRGSRTYTAQGKLSTFLFRIATNRWIDYYRSMKPRPKLRSLDHTEFDDDDPLSERVPAEIGDPGQATDVDAEKLELRRAIHRLSLPHRLVFELAVYQALPYQDISELLSIPEGTVKSRMHNAVKALRRVIEEERSAVRDSFREPDDRSDQGDPSGGASGRPQFRRRHA